MAEHRIGVLVATFRRPDELALLLDDLADVVDQAPSEWTVDVVVCDNDPAGSARTFCEGDTPVPVTYVHEPRPGIANARNALLAASVGDHDLVAFIDDDERARPDWLHHLVTTSDTFDADVVAGAVDSDFEEEPPAWLASSRWFRSARHPTGTPVTWVSTANVLIRTSALEDPPLRFHEDFGLTGGSDTLLFLQMGGRGARIVWCDEAEVRAVVPRERSNLRWVLRRAFRIGNSHPRFDRALGRPRRTQAVRAAKGVGWIGLGLLHALVGGVRLDRRRIADALDRVAWGSGMLAGAFGYGFQEYRRKPSG